VSLRVDPEQDEDEDEFEDEDDKRRTSERSRGASGSIRTSARDGESEHCA